MALVELWILLWTFSVCCWKNILAHIFLLLFFRRQRQEILQFLPWSIFTLEATKDSNTCVETIWWHYGGCARERVASFRRYCTIFSDFFSLKKRFRLKKRDFDISLKKETKTRGIGCNTGNIFDKDIKIRKYTFKLFWPSKFFGQILLTSLPKSLSEAHLPLFKFIVMCHLNLSHLTNVNLA